MKPSGEIARYIARKEALVRVAYPDGANFAIGLGHNSSTVKAGDMITREAAFKLFAEDLAERAAIVSVWLKAELLQQEFDALLSAYYNAGSKVRAVAELVNRNQRDAALALLLTFNKVKGQVNKGLAKRRAEEIAIFTNGDYGDIRTFREYDGLPGVKNFKLVEFPTDFP